MFSSSYLQAHTMNDKINLEAKLATFSEHYQPRTVAQMNDHDVMVVKLKGPFIWHKHDETDDFFLVLRGTLDIELRDRVVTLGPGELFVVPKGVEHRPVAREEVHLLLIEPTGTPNTVIRPQRLHASSPDTTASHRTGSRLLLCMSLQLARSASSPHSAILQLSSRRCG